jgi:hypothetical protein
MRFVALQGLPVAPVPWTVEPRFILSWSWLPSGVSPAIDRPVCSPGPGPCGPSGAIRAQASLRPRLALLRFRLPSALRFPERPVFGEVASPAGSAFRFLRPLDGLRDSGSSRPCFMPLTLLGFALQSFPLPGSRAPLGVVAPLRLGATPFVSDLHSLTPVSAGHARGRAGAGPPRAGPLRLALPRRPCLSRG